MGPPSVRGYTPSPSRRSSTLARISDVINPFFVMATSAGTSFPRNVQVGAPGSAFPGPNHTSQILRRLPLKYYTLYGILVHGIRTADLSYSVYICTTSTATPRPNRTQQYTVWYTTYHSTTVYVSLLCDNKPNFYFIF
jgi:hypothetical protein